MVKASQTLAGETSGGLSAERKIGTEVAGGTASLEVGGNGFHPAVQAEWEMKKKPPVNGESIQAGATVTATVGQGISSSAYAEYEVDKGKTKVRLGISGEYNQRSGASVSVGGRVDYNTGATVGPVTNISPYGSAIASTSKERTSAEVGVCGTAGVAGHNITGCVGVGTHGVTIGVGAKF